MHIIDIIRMHKSFMESLNNVADKLNLPRPTFEPNPGDVGMATVRFGDVAKVDIAVSDDKPLTEIIAGVVLLHGYKWRLEVPLRAIFHNCIVHYGISEDEIFFDERANTIITHTGRLLKLPKDDNGKEVMRQFIVNHIVSTYIVYRDFHTTFENLRRHAAEFSVKFHQNATDYPLFNNMLITDCGPLLNNGDYYVDLLIGSGNPYRCHSPAALQDRVMWVVHHRDIPQNIKDALNRYRESHSLYLRNWNKATGAVVTVDGNGPFEVRSRQDIEALVEKADLEKEKQ